MNFDLLYVIYMLGKRGVTHDFSHKSKQTFNSLYVGNVDAPDMPKNDQN